MPVIITIIILYFVLGGIALLFRFLFDTFYIWGTIICLFTTIYLTRNTIVGAFYYARKREYLLLLIGVVFIGMSSLVYFNISFFPVKVRDFEHFNELPSFDCSYRDYCVFSTSTKFKAINIVSYNDLKIPFDGDMIIVHLKNPTYLKFILEREWGFLGDGSWLYTKRNRTPYFRAIFNKGIVITDNAGINDFRNIVLTKLGFKQIVLK
jgi:hypothetical protein